MSGCGTSLSSSQRTCLPPSCSLPLLPPPFASLHVSSLSHPRALEWHRSTSGVYDVSKTLCCHCMGSPCHSVLSPLLRVFAIAEPPSQAYLSTLSVYPLLASKLCPPSRGHSSRFSKKAIPESNT